MVACSFQSRCARVISIAFTVGRKGGGARGGNEKEAALRKKQDCEEVMEGKFPDTR